MPDLIIVSNRLPVRIQANGEAERTAGGLASALEGAGLGDGYLWVGWGGATSEEIDHPLDYQEKLSSIGLHPVFLDATEVEGYYDGYANATLWPLLHYMIERARFEPEWMGWYRIVNQKFAEVIARKATQGAQVWIHDYHLFLLPRLLRQLRPDLKIGFFLHTPFPASEVFRALPDRNEILEGLLGSDLIGFHTYGYLRHFRSSLLRVLGLEGEPDGVLQDNRLVKFGVYPIGHNRSGFIEAMESPRFAEALEGYGEKLVGEHMVLNVERLDYTKGVPQKLEAIRKFLHENPDWRRKIHFVLVAVPSRTGVREYDELTERVQREVGAINGEFGVIGHSPVQFLHRGFPLDELAALYARADVCLVTPIVDGMNLVAKEYIDCKREEFGAHPGVLILSEFAGAAQEMSQALQVNPHDTDGVARALKEALQMSDTEKRRRVEAMQSRLARNDARAWAKRFLADLDQTSTVEDHSVSRSFEDLLPLVNREIHKGGPVAVFLDYDGTLRGFTERPEDAVPDEDLIALLSKFGTHPAIRLAVISGRPVDFLEKHFGKIPVDLIAEHGYRWKIRGLTDGWELVDPRVDNSWKEVVLPHLEWAVTLTPGTEVEVKHSAIVWHYRRADPEFGLWRAKGLLSELTSITANLPVSVHHGKKIVEVASQMVNKGVAVDRLIRHWQPRMAFAAGDDQTDETMFALKPEGLEEAFLTLKVGPGSSRADYRTTVGGLRRLLEDLARDLPTSTAQ
ncbi:MAG: bifunctional alpha,alpha-trehalose-phosphate synthase (UDP-forming)/trehalose-phosphatase [Luteolibacter sp.]